MSATYLPCGLDFPPEAQREGWLFTPSCGDGDYVDGDRMRNLAAQPLDANGDPEKFPRYLNPRLMGPTQTVQPPVLNFGWVLDEARFMTVVRQHFPNCVQKRLGTADSLKSAIKVVSPQDNADCGPLIMGESVFATCFSSTLRDEISHYIKVPRSYLKLELVHFAIFWDNRGNKMLGITAGNNYAGVLHPHTRARLCQLFDLCESDGQWFLDQRQCYWTPRVTLADVKALRKQVKASRKRAGSVCSTTETVRSLTTTS